MIRGLLRGLAVAVGVGVLLGAPSASAHDATSTAYAEVRGAADGVDAVAVLELEYDLLMKSAWLYAEAYEATERDEQLRQLSVNASSVATYVVDRFQVAYDDRRCVGSSSAPASVVERDGRAFAVLTVDYACDGAPGGSHAIFSALFPDSENHVHDTRTMLRYDIDGVRGAAALDAASPETAVTPREHGLGTQALEFFRLGAEHLLLGFDHVLFVLALVIGSQTLRDVVQAASAFTAAHSLTFLLAALGLVSVPPPIVEPLIALSIVAVALAHLVRRAEAPGRWRLPVVFGFGLLHGLGFAGALGIDAAWSWELLWSLLAFNLGIEAVQLALVSLLFPAVVLLRRTRVGAGAVTASAGVIAAVALAWLAA